MLLTEKLSGLEVDLLETDAKLTSTIYIIFCIRDKRDWVDLDYLTSLEYNVMEFGSSFALS